MIRKNQHVWLYMAKFQGISPETVGIRVFSPGEKLIEQGKRGTSVFVIQSGIAKCFVTEDTGSDFIQEFFGEGELFGEIEALNGNLSFCSVEAITEVKVYKLAQQQFLSRLEEDKLFNRLIMQAMATKINYKALRHAYHQSHTIEHNLRRLMQAFPELLEMIPKQDIANYLGITLRSLNRTILTLHNKNLQP